VLADGIGPEAEQVFEDRVSRFIDVCKELRVEPVLCTFAASHGVHNVEAMPTRTRLFLARYNIYLSVQGWMGTTKRLNAAVRRIAVERSILLIDVDAAVGGHPWYFRDFVHFTREGHRVVAETLAAGLVKVGSSGTPSMPVACR